jgi:hypothetical protein
MKAMPVMKEMAPTPAISMRNPRGLSDLCGVKMAENSRGRSPPS